jgi:hypothetical protein
MTRKGRIVKSRRFEPALPELERRLTTAAAARRKGSGRRIVGSRSTRIAVAGLACLAFGGSAMAADWWDPGIGTDTLIEGDGSALYGEGPATLARTPVPAAETEVLGVLRRDPTAEDRGAEVEATLAGVSFVDRVRPDSVRFLAPGARGKATIVLSAERSLETEIFHEMGDAICVFRPDPVDRSPMDMMPACFSISFVLSGRGYAEELNNPPGRGLAIGLVPDGVASVTAEFLDAPEMTVPVKDNYFEIPMSAGQLGEAGLNRGIQRVLWRDANGDVIPQQSKGADTGTPAWKTVAITR